MTEPDLFLAKQQIEQRGWALLPALIDPQRCEAFLAAVERIWSDLGRPPLYSRSDVPQGPDAVVSPVGLAIHRARDRIPGLRELVLPPPVTRLVDSILGPARGVELESAVLSDETRPFLFWHHHVGGAVDARDNLARPVRYPTFERIERLACTFYPVPLDDAHGVMLVHPRRVSDPTEPPFEDLESPWPVQEEVRCPAGSLLVADQSVWHAVTPMGRPGRRAFAAAFVVPGAAGR